MNIIQELIEYYEETIKLLEHLNYYQAHDLVKERYVHWGVCRCAIEVFGCNIEYEDWVNENIPLYRNYWYRVPYFCSTKEMIYESLQKRLEILKNEHK